MELKGQQRIAASREKVFEALNDPEILQQSIPGCQSLTKVEAKVGLKIGPVKANFDGQVTLSDLNPPESYTISGEGKGGSAGHAKGSAQVTLTEDGDGTLLDYDVNAVVGGKLAQLGARLIDSTAKRLAQQFFTKFGELVEGGEPAAVQTETTAKTEAAGSNQTLLWVIAAVIVLIIGYYLFV